MGQPFDDVRSQLIATCTISVIYLLDGPEEATVTTAMYGVVRSRGASNYLIASCSSCGPTANCQLLLTVILVTITTAGNVTESMDLNIWQSHDVWNCNTPLVKDDLCVTSYLQQSDGSRHMLLYGGSMRSMRYSDETWSYSLGDNIWSKIVTDNDDKPTARRHHSMVTVCNDTIILFGGTDNRNHALNETLIFDTTELKWKRPIVRWTSRPVPAMFNHAAVPVAVKAQSTPCWCKQSVLIFPPSVDERTADWSTLWELSCIRDRLEYKWNEIKMKSRHNPRRGRPKLVTATGDSESPVITLGYEGMWKYWHNETRWKLISNKSTTIHSTSFGSTQEIVRNKRNFAIFFPVVQRYVIINLERNRDMVTYKVEDDDWVVEPLFGLFEESRRTGVAVVLGSYALVYRGQLDACRQSISNLTRVASVWLWSRLPDTPLRPYLATQRVLGVWKHNFYVAGRLEEGPSQRSTPKPSLWKLNLETLQWFQLNNREIPRGDVKSVITNSVVLLERSYFVIYRVQFASEIVTYYPEMGKWSTFLFDISPVERRYHIFVSYNSSAVLLFGGFVGARNQKPGADVKALNDMWILTSSRVQELRWTLLEPMTETDNENVTSRPEGRAQHVAAVIHSKLLIYGGINSRFSLLTDMWSYDLQQSRWELLEPVSPGPIRLNRRWKMTGVAVGHQMVVTVGCTNPHNPDSHRDYCNGTELQTTWMYSPIANNWTLLSTTNYLHTLFRAREYDIPDTLFDNGQLLMMQTQVSPQLNSFRFECPPGMASVNVISTPCQPCPVGAYSNANGRTCNNCPFGLTTDSNGSHKIEECNKCVENYCSQGNCILTQREGRPAPSCQCRFGFTGPRCRIPTYIVAGIGLVIIVTLACFSVIYLIGKWKNRRLREGELQRRVEELTSVWQIGHYELFLLDKIGEGGFGKVHRAVYRETVVAVKVSHSPEQDEQTSVEFEREIVFMQTVRHPNIVMFIGAGKMNDGSRFLVTEFMHRGSLRDLLNANKATGLTFVHQVKFAIDAAKGMQFLHGLKPVRMHRDFKSPNLLVSKQWVVKVADFGLGCQILTETSRTSWSCITSPLLVKDLSSITKIGTTQWRAPELCTSSRYGTSADVYRFDTVSAFPMPYSNFTISGHVISLSLSILQFWHCSLGNVHLSASILSIQIQLSDRGRCSGR